MPITAGRLDNAIFRKTAHDFDVPAGKCGSIAEIREIAPTGGLELMPGIHVRRLIQDMHEKRMPRAA
ncbi:hypothetical protein [Paracoccus sp. (in: a-proteobacteria)]|uniref:hypothetical protein n=1 Tax=Paracoccus sp. TaxID=267 RepID=UPI0039E409BE